MMYNTQMIPARFFGLDDWFDSFHEASKNDSTCTPRAAVAEKDGDYILEVDLPGTKKEDIEVHIENDTLKIKAVRKTATAEMHYERAFKIAKELDAEAAEVTFENGVLSVKLGKKASATARKLVIK